MKCWLTGLYGDVWVEPVLAPTRNKARRELQIHGPASDVEYVETWARRLPQYDGDTVPTYEQLAADGIMNLDE